MFKKRRHFSSDCDGSDYWKTILSGEGLEPITEALISELTSRGVRRGDILHFKNEGCQYCRQRNSFVFPTEFYMR